MFLSPLEFQTDLELPLASLPSLPEVSDGPHCDGLSRAHLLDLIMLVTRHPDRYPSLSLSLLCVLTVCRSVMEAALAILRRNDGPEGEARSALRLHHRAACFCGEPQRVSKEREKKRKKRREKTKERYLCVLTSGAGRGSV